MQWLAETCVRRPVFATVIILILSVVGLFSYGRLGVDRFPKVDFPIVTIVVRQIGASPEEIETEVVDKIEESVNTVSGIDQLYSTSYEGVGIVTVAFVLEKDINVAVQEVRDKVNAALPLLPKDIEQPTVDKVDTDASPILDIALVSEKDVRTTTEYADKILRRQIESINGVGQVRLVGGRARQINIVLDPAKLKSRNLTVLDVQRALQTQNIQIPGGNVDQTTRELTLRTYGRVGSVSEFNDIPIAKQGVTSIRLSDVGSAEDGMETATSVATLNGKPTIVLSVRKQSGLNTVATVDSVLARLKQIEKTLPSGYQIVIARDQSKFIKAANSAVQEHLVVGSILAALVVLLFLWNYRTTIIAAIAIPTSIVSTFGLMSYMGFTINGLTLLALTLSVGIVIDDAIVVLENIYRFVEEKGMNPFEAAIEATREIGLAVLATTLSLIAVFLPVAFMTGIVGRFMNSFGLTMAFAIFISLIVSFTLTPMLSSRWIKMPPPKDEVEKKKGSSKEFGFFRILDSIYTVLLKFSMRHRWVIVVISLGVLYSTVPIGMAVPKNFLPDDDESQFQVSVRAPEGTSLAATQALATRIDDDVKKLPGVEYTLLTIGNSDQQTKNQAGVFVKMLDVEKRKDLTQQDVMQMVRTKVLPKYGSLRASVGPVPAIAGGGGAPTGFSYFISGPSLAKLTEISAQALTELKKVPEAVDVDSSLIVGQPELGVQIDRKRAAELGVSVVDIASALHLMVGGAKVTNFNENGEQYEVHIRAAKSSRSDADVIKEITVPSSTQPGGSVSLEQVVRFTQGTGPSQIYRLNRQRQLTLMANILPGASQATVQEKMTEIVKKLNLPSGYTHGVSGNSREQVKAFGAFMAAFALSLIFMYLILAAQFESWVHPITIMIALPLTVPFALLSILVFKISLNIFSMLGILVLFGVVKKNGILQVDHTNQLRAKGMNRYDAIIAANRDRLRPILMTTFAFVIGMLPLVWSSGTGAATNRNIGYVVIGGQTFSLLLTLLATPVFYSIFDDMKNFALGKRMMSGIGRIFRKG